jgi:cell wall-associated NlpC family hydrolase
MTEHNIRAAIVAEALSWVSTPYHHSGRIKGVGVDCAMLPAEVMERVGLIPHINPEYAHDAMYHEDAEAYLAWVLPYAREIEREQAQPGDLIVFRFGRTYSHSAIVINMPMCIHAAIRAGCVVPVDIDADTDLNWRKRRYFTIVGAA